MEEPHVDNMSRGLMMAGPRDKIDLCSEEEVVHSLEAEILTSSSRGDPRTRADLSSNSRTSSRHLDPRVFLASPECLPPRPSSGLSK